MNQYALGAWGFGYEVSPLTVREGSAKGFAMNEDVWPRSTWESHVQQRVETRVHIADVPVVAMSRVFFDGERAGSALTVDPSDRLRAPAGASAAYSDITEGGVKAPLLKKVRAQIPDHARSHAARAHIHGRVLQTD